MKNPPQPWKRFVVGLAVLAGVCFLVGIIAVIVGATGLHAVCSSTVGNTTTVTGCPGTGASISWGLPLAGLGILLGGTTLAVGALASAISTRQPADRPDVS
jgi:hypothetical protein